MVLAEDLKSFLGLDDSQGMVIVVHDMHRELVLLLDTRKDEPNEFRVPEVIERSKDSAKYNDHVRGLSVDLLEVYWPSGSMTTITTAIGIVFGYFNDDQAPCRGDAFLALRAQVTQTQAFAGFAVALCNGVKDIKTGEIDHPGLHEVNDHIIRIHARR